MTSTKRERHTHHETTDDTTDTTKDNGTMKTEQPKKTDKENIFTEMSDAGTETPTEEKTKAQRKADAKLAKAKIKAERAARRAQNDTDWETHKEQRDEALAMHKLIAEETTAKAKAEYLAAKRNHSEAKKIHGKAYRASLGNVSRQIGKGFKVMVFSVFQRTVVSSVKTWSEEAQNSTEFHRNATTAAADKVNETYEAKRKAKVFYDAAKIASPKFRAKYAGLGGEDMFNYAFDKAYARQLLIDRVTRPFRFLGRLLRRIVVLIGLGIILTVLLVVFTVTVLVTGLITIIKMGIVSLVKAARR